MDVGFFRETKLGVKDKMTDYELAELVMMNHWKSIGLPEAFAKEIVKQVIEDMKLKEVCCEEEEECERCGLTHCEEDKHFKKRELWKSNTEDIYICRSCVCKEDEEQDED
jgi:hypothetical protein